MSAPLVFRYKRPPGMSKAQWVRLSDLALKELRNATPVDTGRLRDGWQPVATTQRMMVFRNDVPYAGYVNDGTPRMAPRDITGRAMVRLGTLAGIRI